MISKTLAKAKQNPGVAMVITLGALAGAAVAIWNFSGVIDSSIVTHAELAQIFKTHSATQHPASEAQIHAIRQESQCSSVDIQIAILSDVIWRLEQSEPNSLRLVEKRSDMTKLQERRVALKCAELA